MGESRRGHPVAADVVALLFSLVVGMLFWNLAHGTHGWVKWPAWGMYVVWAYCTGHFLMRLWRRFRDGVPS